MSASFRLLAALSFLLAPGCAAESEHRTKAASEKLSDLYCYRCDTIGHGDRCLTLKDNTTAIHAKCAKDQLLCQVQTITMSSSTEDKIGPQTLWLLQRNCTKICEPVCVTIGERTKLRSCTTCCDTSFCNSGNGGDALRVENDLRILIATLITSLGIFVFDRDKSKYA